MTSGATCQQQQLEAFCQTVNSLPPYHYPPLNDKSQDDIAGGAMTSGATCQQQQLEAFCQTVNSLLLPLPCFPLTINHRTTQPAAQ